MALYEVREHDKPETKRVEWDKDKALLWADEQTKLDGLIYDVYEIKHVYVTSLVKEDEAFDIF